MIVASEVPPGAALAGYRTKVFYDDFDTLSTIDLTNSKAGGFKWYTAQWFTNGSAAYNADQFSISGSVLKIGNGTGVWPNLTTAFDTGLSTYTGTVFGGGAYIEACLSFDPSLSAGGANGAPNFYGMSIEHIFDNESVAEGHWPGQAANYAHFIEVDIFETLSGNTSNYQSNNHDWAGVRSGTYPQNIFNGGSNIIGIGAVDFRKMHTYGVLWIPASGTRPGCLNRYFDNQLMKETYFLGPPGSPPLPTDVASEYTPETPAEADRTYSIIDSHRLSLIIGGGQTWPMYVDWVKVWK